MISYIFPGQGSQFPSMGRELFEHFQKARDLFKRANEVLGFKISEILFEGSTQELKETKMAQPAIYIHSVILAKLMNDFNPFCVAGHSLGEFSALAAINAIDFEEGLKLVQRRAMAMQKACERNPLSGMVAVLGLEEKIVEEVCGEIKGVFPANYNAPGQIILSGEEKALEKASEVLKKRGAKRLLPLLVSGAFHSPFMQGAKEELALAIENTPFKEPICPIYQNVDGLPTTLITLIKQKLIDQLTQGVRWQRTVENIIEKGIDEFVEIGPGNVLQGLVKKINKQVKVSSAKVII